MKFGYFLTTTAKKSDLPHQEAYQQLAEQGCDRIVAWEQKSVLSRTEQFTTFLQCCEANDIVVLVDLTDVFQSPKELIQVIQTVGEQHITLQALAQPWVATLNPTELSVLNELQTILHPSGSTDTSSVIYRNKKTKRAVPLILQRYFKDHCSIESIAQETGLSRPTIYRVIEKEEAQQTHQVAFLS